MQPTEDCTASTAHRCTQEACVSTRGCRTWPWHNTLISCRFTLCFYKNTFTWAWLLTTTTRMIPIERKWCRLIGNASYLLRLMSSAIECCLSIVIDFYWIGLIPHYSLRMIYFHYNWCELIVKYAYWLWIITSISIEVNWLQIMSTDCEWYILIVNDAYWFWLMPTYSELYLLIVNDT